MWNTDNHILWNHIPELFYEDLNCGLHTCPNLSLEHIRLGPFSKMNVRLAAQVLSSSVSTALKAFGPAEASRTAEYCQMLNDFFDCVNVKNFTDCFRNQNPFFNPFYLMNDERLVWLTKDF